MLKVLRNTLGYPDGTRLIIEQADGFSVSTIRVTTAYRDPDTGITRDRSVLVREKDLRALVREAFGMTEVAK